jgi:uncharacterized OB-fold protein
LSGRGTVYTFTIVHHSLAPGLDRVPYSVALVSLPDAGDVRLLGNVVGLDSSELHIGMPVRVEWHDIRDGVAVPRFKPDLENDT